MVVDFFKILFLLLNLYLFKQIKNIQVIQKEAYFGHT